MSLGAQQAVLSRNIFRPSEGPLTVDFKPQVSERVTVKVFNLLGQLIGEMVASGL